MIEYILSGLMLMGAVLIFLLILNYNKEEKKHKKSC
jgi:preprotein translocase subunit YajC